MKTLKNQLTHKSAQVNALEEEAEELKIQVDYIAQEIAYRDYLLYANNYNIDQMTYQIFLFQMPMLIFKSFSINCQKTGKQVRVVKDPEKRRKHIRVANQKQS